MGKEEGKESLLKLVTFDLGPKEQTESLKVNGAGERFREGV